MDYKIRDIRKEEYGVLEEKEQFDEECWRKHLEKLYTGEEASHRRDKSFYKKQWMSWKL